MANHTVSPDNPLHVTGADQYRISFVLALTPEHRDFRIMQEYFAAETHNSQGYALAFLESEEHSMMAVASIEKIDDYQTGKINPRIEHFYGWPHGKGWDNFIPHNTWNENKEGLVTEFEHPQGGKVVVYEYLDTRDDKKIPMITFHCEQCHNFEQEEARENTNPHMRRWLCRKARGHVHRPEEFCQPMNPQWNEIVTAVVNSETGRNDPVVSTGSRCATGGPCSRIRHFRARS